MYVTIDEGMIDAHSSAKGPTLVFTLRPNVERYKKEPSNEKCIMASKACLVDKEVSQEKEKKIGNSNTSQMKV